MTTTRRSLEKRRPARHTPDEAKGTPGVIGATTEGEAVDFERTDMAGNDLESRVAELRAQLIALQATLVALVPVISIVDADDIRAAMRAACRRTARALEAARYSDDEVAAVVREIETINGEILDTGKQPESGYIVRALPC